MLRSSMMCPTRVLVACSRWNSTVGSSVEALYLASLAGRSETALQSRVRAKSASHLVLQAATAGTIRCLLQLVKPFHTAIAIDIGTHCGYSAALLAESAPTATVHTIDRDARAQTTARENLAELGARVVFHHGDAVESLQSSESLLTLRGAVDVVLVDAGAQLFVLFHSRVSNSPLRTQTRMAIGIMLKWCGGMYMTHCAVPVTTIADCARLHTGPVVLAPGRSLAA